MRHSCVTQDLAALAAAVLGLAVPVFAWADCASLLSCGGSASTSHMRMRKGNVQEVWFIGPVPSAPLVLLSQATYESTVNNVMRTYGDLSLYIPDDYAALNATSEFRVQWVLQRDIAGKGSGRSGIPAAGTISDLDIPDYPCRIKNTTMMFALDPTDGQGGKYCWGDVYSSICGMGTGIGVLDFESAVMHEFGHALGLDHSTEPGAVMAQALWPDIASRVLLDCESNYLCIKYRENFGPSVLDSFTVARSGPNGVLCSWSASVETGIRAYRLTRTCSDGVSTLLADSIACQGVGVPYSVSDMPPCSGLVDYTLAVVDSTAQGTVEEKLLALRKFDAGSGALPTARAVAMGTEDSTLRGFATAEGAVIALGAAISERDDVTRRRAIADGFGYYTRDGQYWGKSIDGILEASLRACLRASDTTVDSLAFVPLMRRSLGENMIEVIAEARYLHRCGSIDSEWAGEIIATVERGGADEGWRVRQVIETK